MIRATVAGIAGRMGSRIAQIIQETPGIELAGGFDQPEHPKVGRDIAEVIGGPAKGMIISGSIEDAIGSADVVIDFTSASASLKHLETASRHGAAVVIGSTGFIPEMIERARQLTQSIPCVLAPNMSVGVNVLFKIVADLAVMLGDDFDVEIVEAHHRFKKDAPSGTAVRLAEIVASSLGRDISKAGVYSRHGIIGERTAEEIGVQTVRAGDIVGDHTVIFGGMGERIELIHRAHSRDNFARGALRAAMWVVGKQPGLYDMQNVLGIK